MRNSLRRQLGFIYLTTGANGAGKTLFTLKDVRERQLKESRPVYHNGRFRLKADFGWHQIDFKDWQSAPDGAIFLIDECHNDMPIRRSGAEVPDHIKMLAEHRVRGFDFYLITQHPSNIDVFVRRIIGSPGWHRHLKNAWGSPLVSRITWNSVKTDCEKSGAGEDGTVDMVARPKEVFDWYESATLHTAKPKLPKQFWFMAAALLLVPALGYGAYSTFMSTSFMKAAQGENLTQKPADATGTTSPAQTGPAGRSSDREREPMTPAEYVQHYAPRIPDLPYTAPAYDGLTEPKQAPYPAACIASRTKCACFTQQATPLTVSDSTCRDIVKQGFYMAWLDPSTGQQVVQASTGPTAPPEPGTLNLKF
ncbi:zonular occludens toxin domain-containing protein [Macromonas nakdongensis]|uniref:zonular occludens toxin domain-containing protein n=1 Tax=Macromonas nakdongensis TaxID=1843082 RepID=UPI0012FEE03C|nr:zonular occludens toxin domain-containing protein [Macromonas nakdongensis]